MLAEHDHVLAVECMRLPARYEDTLLPTGGFTGTPVDALDCACQLHLAGSEI